jgi:hypothetical protein
MVRKKPTDNSCYGSSKAKQRPIPNEVPIREKVVGVFVFSRQLQLQKVWGLCLFSYTSSAKDAYTTIENKLVKLKIANKGGYIVEATLKNFERFREGSGQLVKLIKITMPI